MYTECPICFRSLTITSKHLQIDGAAISCPHCSASFDAVKHLCADLPPELIHDPLLITNHKSRPLDAWVWVLGIIFSLCLLITQTIYFNQKSWLNNPSIRVWVNPVCQVLYCNLPSFKQIKKLKILNSSLSPIAKEKYLLTIKLKNRARLAQGAPAIKISLVNYNGELFAERIFDSHEYQLFPSTSEIEPRKVYRIELSLRVPQQKVGGHLVEFLK